MSEESKFVAIGGIVNSALYLASVFVASIFMHSVRSELVTIAAMGVTFLSYMIQHASPRGALVLPVALLSIFLGALAFGCLLWDAVR